MGLGVGVEADPLSPDKNFQSPVWGSSSTRCSTLKSEKVRYVQFFKLDSGLETRRDVIERPKIKYEDGTTSRRIDGQKDKSMTFPLPGHGGR